MMKIEALCYSCKKPFEKKTTNHIRCLKCANNQKCKLKETRFGICEGCLSEYEKNTKAQRFCSIICRKKLELCKSNAKWANKNNKGCGLKVWSQYK